MALRSGARLGPYEVLALIGAGGMGEVYRARDPRLGREVAIKVVATDIAAEPRAAVRFEREARAVAQLSHPNILAIHDIGHHDGVTYAVTELLQGESLRSRLGAGAVPLRRALAIATDIARGLAAAHDAGIVHRDVKPENVFVTTDGHVKILDFGLARTPQAAFSRAETGVGAAITEAGTLLGTPGYMAPEQVQGETCDHRADIFALGAVLFELVTGQRAFHGTSSIDVMRAVLREEPDVSALASVPGTVRRLMLRCLEKRPDDRFGSARDLGFALEAATDAESGTGVTRAPVRHAAGRAAIWTSAIGVLSLIAVLAWALRVARSDPSGRNVASSWRYAISVPGQTNMWTFSPDGRRLAALIEGDIRPDAEDLGSVTSALWVRDSADSEWRQRALSNDPTPPYLSGLAWSPDGKSVAYNVTSRGSPELRVVDVVSGAVRPLARGASPQGGMAWSAQSGILIGGSTLRLVAPDTGAVTEALAPDATIAWRRWPSYLADGRSFVFTQNGKDERQRGIFLGRVGSQTISRLIASVSNAVVTRAGYLLFGYRGSVMAVRLDTAAGRIVGEPQQIASRLPTFWGFTWFAISPDDTLLTPPEDAAGVPMQLTLFDRDGRTMRTIGSADAYAQIELSPDARQLAVERLSALGIVDIAQGTLTPVTEEAQLTGPPPRGWSDRATLPTGFVDPVWSPDGRTLAAAAMVEERFGDLVQIDLTSREVHALLTGPGQFPEVWSKDGTEILLTRGQVETPGTRIWTVHADSPATGRALTPAGGSTADDPQLSPDGQWLTYTSNETGSWEIYLQGFKERRARSRISPSGGVQTRWSDDGKELFYLRLDGRLISVAMNGLGEPGVQTPLFKLNSAPDPYRNQFVVLPGARQFIGMVPTTEHPDPPSLSALTNATSVLAK